MNEFSYLDNNFIKQNKGLIKIALNKYLYYSGISEDIFQEAYIWLCEAKLKYNAKKKLAWSTYAKYYIQHSYLSYIRKNKALKRNSESFKYTFVSLDSIDENDLYNKPFDRIEETILYDSIIEYLLNGRDKEIVILISLGFTYNEISENYNISIERVRQIYYKQIEIIKEKIYKR
jgi:RNA polymerase sigma factor (sigma-70 family)